MAQELQYEFEVEGVRRRVQRVSGDEVMNRHFRFEVTVRLDPGDPVDPDAIVGAEAALVLLREGELRRIVGVVADSHRSVTRKGNAAHSELVVVLEPRLAMLRYRVDLRIFRDKTAPAIVEEVLSQRGVKVTNRLAETYPVRPYCVQMRESDLDFTARLLEDEGIFGFFDESGAFVMGDRAAAYDDPGVELLFRHGSGLDQDADDAIVEVGWVGRITPGKVSLRDFNHEHPSLNMDVSAKGPWSEGPEWYDYPGEYELPHEGSRKARLRAQALECVHHRLAGRAFSGRIRPGINFMLSDAPPGVDDGIYVVVRTHHDYTRDVAGYSIRFEALPADVVYRPEVITPAPQLVNPLTGFATGSPGEDIHTDSWGRVKVHFPWDRLQPKDDRCSHWIPVLQENTGSSSAHPRVGWEVMCQFLEGDPDRPVVIGRVYNSEDTFPELLPEQKMVTSLRSLSSPSRKGHNHIRIDDTAGVEMVHLHSERDQNVIVGNNKKEEVLDSESSVVRANERIQIGSNQTIQVDRRMMPQVAGNQTLDVGGSRTTEVSKSQNEDIAKNRILSIGGSYTRKAGETDSVTVKQNLKETIAGLALEATVKTNATTAMRMSAMVVGGAKLELALKQKSEAAGKARAEAIGVLSFLKTKDRIGIRVTKNRLGVIGGTLKVDALKRVVITGLEKLEMKAGTFVLKGDEKLTLKVGKTEVIMSEGHLVMKAEESIRFETKAESKQGSKTSTQI